jgi:hypothetical protein
MCLYTAVILPYCQACGGIPLYILRCAQKFNNWGDWQRGKQLLTAAQYAHPTHVIQCNVVVYMSHEVW